MIIYDRNIRYMIYIERLLVLFSKIGFRKKVVIIFTIGLLQPGIADIDYRVVIEGLWLMIGVDTQYRFYEASSRAESSVVRDKFLVHV